MAKELNTKCGGCGVMLDRNRRFCSYACARVAAKGKVKASKKTTTTKDKE